MSLFDGVPEGAETTAKGRYMYGPPGGKDAAADAGGV